MRRKQAGKVLRRSRCDSNDPPRVFVLSGPADPGSLLSAFKEAEDYISLVCLLRRGEHEVQREREADKGIFLSCLPTWRENNSSSTQPIEYRFFQHPSALFDAIHPEAARYIGVHVPNYSRASDTQVCSWCIVSFFLETGHHQCFILREQGLLWLDGGKPASTAVNIPNALFLIMRRLQKKPSH